VAVRKERKQKKNKKTRRKVVTVKMMKKKDLRHCLAAIKRQRNRQHSRLGKEYKIIQKGKREIVVASAHVYNDCLSLQPSDGERGDVFLNASLVMMAVEFLRGERRKRS
jgi:hypothetical protein